MDGTEERAGILQIREVIRLEGEFDNLRRGLVEVAAANPFWRDYVVGNAFPL